MKLKNLLVKLSPSVLLLPVLAKAADGGVAAAATAAITSATTESQTIEVAMIAFAAGLFVVWRAAKKFGVA